MTDKPKIVIVGGGFGGLAAIKELKGVDADITVIDRRNHHLFQPLLYQVATTSLGPSEIAWPIRQLVHRRREITTLLSSVTGIDTAAKLIRLENGTEVSYDYVILATGAQHAYFGHDDWEPYAPGLKTLEDATAMRRKLLVAFERAELEAVGVVPFTQKRTALKNRNGSSIPMSGAGLLGGTGMSASTPTGAAAGNQWFPQNMEP